MREGRRKLRMRKVDEREGREEKRVTEEGKKAQRRTRTEIQRRNKKQVMRGEEEAERRNKGDERQWREKEG